MGNAYEIAYMAKSGAAVILTVRGGTREEAEAIEKAIKGNKFRLYTNPYTDETYIYAITTGEGKRYHAERPLSITWGIGDRPLRIEGIIEIA